ncbi:MAG: peptidylprolyl isomerase [Chitinophagaceae bacterium]|nr:peptidylprolyl isomerase [Chitinophagaceae bacterium]
MNKIFLLSVICYLSSVITFAQPTQSKPVLADKIVAIVGDKIILKSDIDNSIIEMQRQGMEIPENGRCLTLEQALSIKSLVLQAEKDSIPISDEEIEGDLDNQVRYFISQYGSKEELERVAAKTVYQLKEDFKDGFKDRKLAQAMRNKIVENIKITPNEVKSYFEKIPVDSLPLYESEIEVSQIVSYPKASRDAEEYCIQQLKEYKEQVETGKKDFKTLASIYTEDPGSKQSGGEYEINRNQKDLDPIWLSKAFTLKEGQISSPFKTRCGYHILQLVSRTGDDAVVRHILKVPQVTLVEINEGKQKLDSVRAKLIAGTIQFGEAVNKYSDDEASKFNAGQVQGRDGSSFITIDELDKNMVTMLKDLQVGQFSQPTEFAEEGKPRGIRIIYLKSKAEPHRENLKDDYNKIAQRALEEKKTVALENWFNTKVASYYIMIDDEFRQCAEMQRWVNAANSSLGKK